MTASGALKVSYCDLYLYFEIEQPVIMYLIYSLPLTARSPVDYINSFSFKVVLVSFLMSHVLLLSIDVHLPRKSNKTPFKLL